MRPHSHARLRHRATAPPPCDLTARTAPPPPPPTALLRVRSRSISWHTSPLYDPLHRESSFKYERRSLNAPAAPLLASGAPARPGRASHRNSPAADDCRHELCAANNYLRCPAPRPGLASPRTSLASPSPLLTPLRLTLTSGTLVINYFMKAKLISKAVKACLVPEGH